MGRVIAIGWTGNSADDCYAGSMLVLSQCTHAVTQMTLPTSNHANAGRSRPPTRWRALVPVLLGAVALVGCASRTSPSLQFDQITETPCQSFLQQIETPDLDCESCTTGDELRTATPLTISNYQDTASWDLTIDQCVEMALANSCLLYTSPSPRDRTRSRMPSSA